VSGAVAKKNYWPCYSGQAYWLAGTLHPAERRPAFVKRSCPLVEQVPVVVQLINGGGNTNKCKRTGNDEQRGKRIALNGTPMAYRRESAFYEHGGCPSGVGCEGTAGTS
jgi:hypothetical protein